MCFLITLLYGALFMKNPFLQIRGWKEWETEASSPDCEFADGTCFFLFDVIFTSNFAALKLFNLLALSNVGPHFFENKIFHYGMRE